MTEYSSTAEFFFLDEMDAERDYISISIGEVWLYFYKQTLIGVRDMRSNKSAFLRVDTPSKPDGYSHRHEITKETVFQATNEPYPNIEPPKYVSADDLTSIAAAWVADGLVKTVDNALRA